MLERYIFSILIVLGSLTSVSRAPPPSKCVPDLSFDNGEITSAYQYYQGSAFTHTFTATDANACGDTVTYSISPAYTDFDTTTAVFTLDSSKDSDWCTTQTARTVTATAGLQSITNTFDLYYLPTWSWPAFATTASYVLTDSATTVSNDLTSTPGAPSCTYTGSSYSITTGSAYASLDGSNNVLIQSSNGAYYGTQTVVVQVTTNQPVENVVSFTLTVSIGCQPTWTWPALSSTASYNLGQSATVVSNDLTQSPACGFTASYAVSLNAAIASMTGSNQVSISSTNTAYIGTQTVQITITTNDANTPTQVFSLSVSIYCQPDWTWTYVTDGSVYYQTSSTASTVSNNIGMTPVDCGYSIHSYTITQGSSYSSLTASNEVQIYTTDVNLEGDYTTTISVYTSDPYQSTWTFDLAVEIRCIPAMTWTYLTGTTYSPSVWGSAIYISNNLVLSPNCPWTPTYTVTAGSSFASMTSSDTVELYTEDASLVGDQTLSVKVQLDNTATTQTTFSNTVEIRECQPTVTYPASQSSYTYMVQDSATTIAWDAYQTPTCGFTETYAIVSADNYFTKTSSDFQIETSDRQWVGGRTATVSISLDNLAATYLEYTISLTITKCVPVLTISNFDNTVYYRIWDDPETVEINLVQTEDCGYDASYSISQPFSLATLQEPPTYTTDQIELYSTDINYSKLSNADQVVQTTVTIDQTWTPYAGGTLSTENYSTTQTFDLNVFVEPCVATLTMTNIVGQKYFYEILNPATIVTLNTVQTPACGYAETYNLNGTYPYAQLSTENLGLANQYEEILIWSRDLADVGYQYIGIVVTLDDYTYGASADYQETFTMQCNLTDPCDYALLGYDYEEIPRQDFVDGRGLFHLLDLNEFVYDNVSIKASEQFYCGNYSYNLTYKPIWLTTVIESNIISNFMYAGSLTNGLFEDEGVLAYLANYTSRNLSMQIPCNSIIMYREDQNQTYVIDDPAYTFLLEDCFISSGATEAFTTSFTIDQSDYQELLQVDDAGVITLGNIIPNSAGYFEYPVNTTVTWGSDGKYWIESYLNIVIKSAVPDIPITLSRITMNAATYFTLSIEALYVDQPNIVVVIADEDGLPVELNGLEITIDDPQKEGKYQIEFQATDLDLPDWGPQSVYLPVTVEPRYNEEDALAFTSVLEAKKAADEAKEQSGPTPFLRYLPFSFDGNLTLLSTCPLRVPSNTSVLFDLDVEIFGTYIPNVDIQIVYQDPEYFAEKNLTHVPKVIKVWDQKKIIINFEFPTPSVISTRGFNLDYITLKLNSDNTIICADGRQFTENTDIIKIEIPLQASASDMEFMQNAAEQSKDAKTIMVIALLGFKTFINSFLGSLVFLGFMAIELGMSIPYPPMVLSFFGSLLGLLNFDLLSEWPIFDIPYEPIPEMAEPLNENLGQIGFDSCSIILGLGTAVWLLALFVVQALFLALSMDFITIRCNKKIRDAIREARKATFFNGLLEQLDSLQLVLVMSTALKTEKTVQLGIGLTDDLDDDLLFINLTILPAIYIFTAIKMWNNYEELKDKESPASETYGYFCADVAFDEVSKFVGIVASFINTLRTYLMCYALATMRQSWAQLIFFIFLFQFETIFVWMYQPYGRGERGSGTDVQKVKQIEPVQIMIYNYFMICMTDFVVDGERKGQVAWLLVYTTQGVILINFMFWLKEMAIKTKHNLQANDRRRAKKIFANRRLLMEQAAIDNRMLEFLQFKKDLINADRMRRYGLQGLEDDPDRKAQMLANMSEDQLKEHRYKEAKNAKEIKRFNIVMDCIAISIENGKYQGQETPNLNQNFFDSLGFFFEELDMDEKVIVVEKAIDIEIKIKEDLKKMEERLRTNTSQKNETEQGDALNEKEKELRVKSHLTSELQEVKEDPEGEDSLKSEEIDPEVQFQKQMKLMSRNKKKVIVSTQDNWLDELANKAEADEHQLPDEQDQLQQLDEWEQHIPLDKLIDDHKASRNKVLPIANNVLGNENDFKISDFIGRNQAQREHAEKIGLDVDSYCKESNAIVGGLNFTNADLAWFDKLKDVQKPSTENNKKKKKSKK